MDSIITGVGEDPTRMMDEAAYDDQYGVRMTGATIESEEEESMDEYGYDYENVSEGKK